MEQLYSMDQVIGIQYMSCPQQKGHISICPASQLNSLPNELQLTCYSCNICWALTTVTPPPSTSYFQPCTACFV